MKKIFAILLIFVCIFSLVACGHKNEEVSDDTVDMMELTLGAGDDNPATSVHDDFEYHPLPKRFKVVSPEKCGIVTGKPYVFRISNDNHPDRYDLYSIIFRVEGSADIYVSDVFLYRTMGGVYQYGKGMIFNMVTGDMIYVKSAEEISFTKDGVEYIGVREDNKAFIMGTPSCSDKYICVKGDTTYAYQFKEDYTVDYYENDVLVETLPYRYGYYAIGLRGQVYCLSTNKVALFIDNDIFTLGGVEYEVPPRGIKYDIDYG